MNLPCATSHEISVIGNIYLFKTSSDDVEYAGSIDWCRDTSFGWVKADVDGYKCDWMGDGRVMDG